LVFGIIPTHEHRLSWKNDDGSISLYDKVSDKKKYFDICGINEYIVLILLNRKSRFEQGEGGGSYA